jgi:4-hydroxy-tetrahydrodipicolinate synthase
MTSSYDRRAFFGRTLEGMVGASVFWNPWSDLFGATTSAKTTYRPGRHEPFAGIFPILQTPFFDDERVDTETFVRQIDFVIEAGGHGLVWPQNASEFQVLTDSERYKMAKLIVERVGGMKPVIIGVQSTNYWKTALEFARHARDMGADGIIALPPYQIKPTVEEVAEFFKTLARTVPLPIFVQNSGGPQGPAMPVEMMIALAHEYPQLAYIKEEARPVLERITEIGAKGKGLIKGVFSGAGGTRLIEELNNGSRGSCPSSGMVDVFSRVFNMYEAGEKKAAEEHFEGLRPMFSFRAEGMHWLFKEKEILRRRGIFKNSKTRIAGDLRWPDAETKARFDEAYAAIEPLFTWQT